MVNKIRTNYPSELNKGFLSKFCVGSRFQHKMPEGGQRTHWAKCCDYINENEENSLNILSDGNIYIYIYIYIYECVSAQLAGAVEYATASLERRIRPPPSQLVSLL